MNHTLAIQDSKRILGVFAHPDDESFCAGGAFAKYVAAGAEVMVVSATRGEAGQIRMPSVTTRRTLGAVREQELHLACQRLGIQHVRCLDYMDGTLKDVDQEGMIRQVTEIIRTFRPAVVITFGPDGGYGHPDHIAVSAATTAACMRSGELGQFPEQIAAGLEPHQPARLYYSYFPPKRQLLLEQLVQWLVQVERGFRGTLDFAYALLLLSEEVTLLRYSSDHFAINWYRAGFSIIEQGERANSLYLILSGTADVIYEAADGTLQVRARLEPGDFFGEEGLAHKKSRNAHVVASENVTCLVFSPGAPTAYLGRGEEAQLIQYAGANGQVEADMMGATTCIDVGPYIQQKIAAIAAHRSQYALEADMLPLPILQELMGREYFVRVHPAPQIETELFPPLAGTHES
jgi:LmbE family N-acetylglucosaminyl deacetylase